MQEARVSTATFGPPLAVSRTGGPDCAVSGLDAIARHSLLVLRTSLPIMNRLVVALLALVLAAPASALTLSGTVTKAGGGAVWPCDLDIFNRQTNQLVNLTNDSTLVNGTYNVTLPAGRYDVYFKPRKGQHIFQGVYLDVRITTANIVLSPVLPLGKYVTGRVVGTDGVGVAGANIRLVSPTGAAPVNLEDSGTNPDGTFATLVDPGVWDVGVVPALASRKAPLLFPDQPMTTADVNLGNVVVPPGRLLTCSVTDPLGFPIANGSIMVRHSVGREKLYLPSNNTSAAGVASIIVPDGTFDVIACPPGTQVATYATNTLYGRVVAGADQVLPNFALPSAKPFSAKIVDSNGANVVNADIDVDWAQPPLYPRIETPNDFTSALGTFTVYVPTGLQRLTVQPAIATRLIPIRIDSLTVGASGLNMGTLVCRNGHWVDVTVLDGVTGLPLVGANVSFYSPSGVRLPTVNSTAGSTGLVRVVADTARYTLKVIPPVAGLDTILAVGAVKSIGDTAFTIRMWPPNSLGVGERGVSALRFGSPWPNPSRDGVSFAFAGRGDGVLEILDLAGRLVATPWRGAAVGESRARWDGRDDRGHRVAGGLYFARLRVGAETQTRRIVLAD